MDYVTPTKAINNQFDLNPWYFSEAYSDYIKFLHDLNDSIKGIKTTDDIFLSEDVINAVEMLNTIQKFISEYPPIDMDNQRFGNKAFRSFHTKLVDNTQKLVEDLLPMPLKPASQEISVYLNDAFGNATRIDYGTGHEASFIIFCFCLFKIGYFKEADKPAVVLRVFEKYLRVCRALQALYKMEPAGSRGVHALDDFQFMPFIWGSAQLIGNKRLVPDSYTSSTTVDLHAHESLFFDAVQFINQTKTGPFHEHSNQLWNISAVPNWQKVNEGLFKMYEAEVLKKFPVVQHILFGSLFSFEKRIGTPTEPLFRTSTD